MITNERNKGKLINEFPSDYTVVDIETTGLSPRTCEIIEISALKVRNDKIVDSFSMLIKPSQSIAPFITKLTGITDEMVCCKPSVEYVLPNFMDFVAEDIILGHNVNFDINFIYDNWQKYYGKAFSNNFADTMRLSRKYCDLKKHNLKFLAKHYGVSIEGHHRALVDCEITFKIYNHIKNEVLSRL